MKNTKNNLPINSFKTLSIFLFALCSCKLIGQIDIDNYTRKFGNGNITLRKKININFVFNETTKQYIAKVSHKYEKLYLKRNHSKGLIQLPFNEFQELNLEKSRYYKLDSIGNKKLIENVKVKYADIKDYYINNIFYSDLKVKQFNCSVDLPEDYIVNYAYNEKYNDLKFLTSFYFQNANEAVEKVEISIKKNPNITFSIFEFNLDGITKTEDENYIKFKGANLKRFKSLPTSVNGSYYLPHIIVSVAETKAKKLVTPILKNTDNLYAWYSSLINELQPNVEFIKKLSKSIVGNETNETKKIEKIFTWVQRNIQYVAFENGIAGFKPTEANDVASLKYGDCKGMANLLVNLLKAQGLDARHVWIGTRAKNYNYNIPSLIVDNHMICGLYFNNKLHYLDATSKSALWNIAPAHLEGKQALIANNTTYEIQTVPLSNPESNNLLITGKIDLAKPKPEIELSFKLNGHFYRDFLSQLTYTSASNKKHVPYYIISDYLDGIKVNNISVIDNYKDTATIKMYGTYHNIAIGSKKIIFPFLDLLIYPRISKNNPPNYIDYPQLIDAKIEISNAGKLPQENYTSKIMEGKNYNASFSTEKIANKFFVKQKISLNILNSSKSENNSWNTFVDQIDSYNNNKLSYD